MTTAAMDRISYEAGGVLLPDKGLVANEIARLAPRLEAARHEVLADLELFRSRSPIPREKEPLDAAFIDLPERLLGDYRQRRQESELNRILATARRLAETIDRVVLLGIGGSYMGARALFEACCHPYHNELSRADRGARPRVYFEGNNVDNDAIAGLHDLLGCGEITRDGREPFAIVVVSKSGGTLETAAALRIFLTALRQACGADGNRLAQLVVPVTGASGRLRELAAALGCTDIFTIPEGVGGRFSIFTAVGLLPAAILGLDIVRLLEGAADMNARFRQAAPGDSPVLDYVAVCHLMERTRGATIRVMSTWGKGLEAAAWWYDQLLSESLGKEGHGATPLSVVNTRDLHSRGQQHQEGRRDKLITNVSVASPRRGLLRIGRSPHDQDGLNQLVDKTIADIMEAAREGTNRAYRGDERPTAELRLPRIDESSLGQFFQMLMLATVVEGRLVGLNPYGQPGVEAYKRHMNAILRSE